MLGSGNTKLKETVLPEKRVDTVGSDTQRELQWDNCRTVLHRPVSICVAFYTMQNSFWLAHLVISTSSCNSHNFLQKLC